MKKSLVVFSVLFCIVLAQSTQTQGLHSESELFTHFLGNPKASAYDIDESEKSLNSVKTLQKYFQIVRGCNTYEGDKCCILSDSEQFCYFSVAQPLHIKGRLRLKNYTAVSECQGEIGEVKSAVIVEFSALEGNAISGSSNIALDEHRYTEYKLLQQLKRGKLGEIVYEVEFDIVNKEGEILFDEDKQGKYAWNSDTYPCTIFGDRGSWLNITNLKVGKKISEE